MEKTFHVQRIRDYRIGKAGLIQVTASDDDSLKAGIDSVFKNYPEFPYGTWVSRIYRDENGRAVMADVQHWGSD